MMDNLKQYMDTWWKIVMKPILFYQDMPKDVWSGAPLTFVLITSWVISFFMTFSVFVIMYIPTGFSLIEGIKGRGLIIVTPVLLLMGLVFFIMTILIIAGFVIGALLGLLFAVAGVLNFLLLLLGGNSNFYETLKAVFYSSSIFLVAILTILLMMPVKWHLISFDNWIVGEKMLFYTAAVYIYGLWSIAGRKLHGVSRWQAFLAAVFPLILLIIINIVLAGKILPKVGTWIS